MLPALAAPPHKESPSERAKGASSVCTARGGTIAPAEVLAQLMWLRKRGWAPVLSPLEGPDLDGERGLGRACEEGQSGQATDCLACEGRKRVASLCFPKTWEVARLLFCPQRGARLTFEPSLVLVALSRAPLCPPGGSASGKAFGLPLATEQHIPLQCRHVGDRPRAAEAAAGTPSLHAAHGPLHWEDDGSGEELRPPDHGQEDIHQVSLWGPGSWLQAGQCTAPGG